MSRIIRGPLTMLAAAACTATVITGAVVPGTANAATAAPICTSARHPRIAGRISHGIAAALAQRPASFVGLAASDPALHLTCALRQHTHFYSASVIKATILGALLLKRGGPGRLSRWERNEAFLMITQSDNNAATALWNDVGFSNMQTFLNRAGMHETILSDAWGLTLITPHDELLLLQLLSYPGTVLNNRARNYELSLMAQVIPSQHWGVSEGAPSNVTVHIKNGWLPYPGSGWNINSIGVFTGTGILYQLVILNSGAGGQSESYGIETIEGAAAIFNRNVASLPSAPAPAPSPTSESQDVVPNQPGG